ncbi:FAD:protein FMN transferase [Planctomicrobium sp. SH664]|uniref:FAD:protein FMN transferase n=1 Tax=Planctomicrobium sp. SH664 TaxID=3448125 RepID=UPI003F5B5D05
MTLIPEPNRRDFLTGRAVQKELRRTGEGIADELVTRKSSVAPQAGDTVRLETRAMACPWSVIMNPGPPEQVMTASDALDFIHDVDELLSVFRESSEVSRLNRNAAQQAQSVSPELFLFLQHCHQLWRETAGTFDPAAGALIQLWRSARQNSCIPTDADIQAALNCSGMQHVRLDPETETVQFDREGLLLDFGAIGKGYALDRGVRHLDREGLQSFLFHGGASSVFARGTHGGHEGWPVGIKNPLFTQRRYATLLLRDEGMSTSGSNIQYFRYRGKRYGHLLDPRTGWPADKLLSVTVLTPTATEAEALSTAFYVMGLDKALAYCDDHPHIGAIFVNTSGQGRTLELVTRNLAEDRLFLEEPAPSE